MPTDTTQNAAENRERISRICSELGRPGVQAQVASKRGAPAVRIGRGGRVVVAEPVAKAFNDQELRALIQYETTSAPGVYLRVAGLFVVSLAWVLVAYLLQPYGSSLATTVALVMASGSVLLLMSPPSYRWVYTPKVRAFRQNGGDLVALGRALPASVALTRVGAQATKASPRLLGQESSMAAEAGLGYDEFIAKAFPDRKAAEQPGRAARPDNRTWLKKNERIVRLAVLILAVLALYALSRTR